MNDEMKLKEIIEKVGGDYHYIKEHPQESLLTWRSGLVARDLLVVYFEIKKTWNLDIPKEIVVNGEFGTYDGMRKVIVRK